ncbi:MAG: UDP-2,3-diacylglucosamine diphosphatase [Candidatus Competibacterales bacterium]
MTSPVVFVADLHLADERTGDIDRFAAFAQQLPGRGAALFLLGDVFDLWLGDDACGPTGEAVAGVLQGLGAAGVVSYFIPGNRDFLVGEAFARRCGLSHLGAEAVVELPTGPCLVLHGDTLCTRDTHYQALRLQMRDPEFQEHFLAKSLPERRALAAHLRAESERAMVAKDPALTDAVPEAVVAAAVRHGVAQVIHGHTHRPGHHIHAGPQGSIQRWVVDDWHGGANAMVADDNGLRPWREGEPLW